MNLPKDFEMRMKNMLGSEYDAFLDAFCNSPQYNALRVNTLKKNSKEAVKKEFSLCEQVEWCADGFYVDREKLSGKHPYHMGGLFYFQEPSAMSAAVALPIEEGDFVLDLCAAPGGKSTQLGAMLNGKGLLVSNEIVKKRAAILSGNIERMGITNAIVTNESPQTLCEKFTGFFDKVLVDAPCSGEGMFRKEPQAIEEWSIEHTLSCGTRQKNILDSAVKMLKSGGMLVYSTCTFAPCENEEVAEYLISHHNMEIVEIQTLSMLSNGSNEWTKNNTEVSSSKRIFPHLHKGEGHFVALFRKKEGFSERTLPNSGKNTLASKEQIKLYRDFEKEFLNTKLEGYIKAFGDRLYLLPYDINVDKIHILRYGLELGECKKNRFEPSHALALALTKEDFKNSISLDLESNDLKKYLQGDVFPSDAKGYCAVCVGDYPLGWGKASDGVVKNKLPKGLRIF